ncbi:MAG: glutamate--tRNA ligase, partial [Brevibacterium sp.]
FDVKKATAINADHIRLLDADDFRDRLVPYLQAAEVLPESPTDAQLAILDQAAPLVQTRMNLLAEAPNLLAFLFTPDAELTMAEDGLKTLKDSAPEVLAASLEVLDGLEDWTTDTLHSTLQAKLVDEMEIKPRLAFGPLRVAVSGRKVSPPLFESMEILGKDSSLTRLRALAAQL